MAMTDSTVHTILSRKGPFIDDEAFNPELTIEFLSQCKVLVIGAGGLGCEILANLSLMGFKHIHVIDMDEIDLSNLNRQFLFRTADIGKPKATVAAAFVMNRVPGVTITPHYCKIQDMDDEFYMQFNIVICGLDSIEARRWINQKLVELVDSENPESLKPLVDGGTEGFKGQSRVILPTITSCYECSMDMLTPKTLFPICTIANTPRLPEHCIEWASVIKWPEVFEDRKINNDDPDDIQWLYDVASERAKQFNIVGVTWSLTQGVVKRIIPAIASTNAIIAASCCNEALKIATSCNPYLNNYMMYTGNESVYTYTFEHEKKDDCLVCGGARKDVTLKREDTLGDLIDFISEDPVLQLRKPSLSLNNKPLYLQAPPQLEESLRPNLIRTLQDIYETSGSTDDTLLISVTDANLPVVLDLAVSFK